MKFIFTSESVSDGHPDKIADQISDAILDAHLEGDPDSKVACECLITQKNVILAGEIKSKHWVNHEHIARNVLKDIGYTNTESGFDITKATFHDLIQTQSLEIYNSVISGGAGDQGLMFGYACNETPDMLPLPIFLAHKLMEKYSHVRRNSGVCSLLPDAKSQVSVEYLNGKPTRVKTIVLSAQHTANIRKNKLDNDILDQVINPVLEEFFPGNVPNILINPSGSFTKGGPAADTGLTGRKIIVDTYGGSCPHGGGAFSGKDPSKVDRSAAYAARYVAKHIVASGIADKCTVQISYAIGIAEPISVYVETHGTGKIPDMTIAERVQEIFDLTPQGIIKTLNLKKPVYRQTAVYGHFGNSNYSWEIVNPIIVQKLNQK
jgi:S-adenosylmethionine synthetase